MKLDAKKIFVDIDETICITPPSRDYSLSTPIIKNIQTINKLYEQGNIVVYWTARGGTTGIDWRSVTEEQLEKWGAKYHHLRLDKPDYDLFIDDKSINSVKFFKENS